MADTNTAKFCWVLTVHQALGTLTRVSALLTAVKCVHTQQLPLFTVPASLLVWKVRKPHAGHEGSQRQAASWRSPSGLCYGVTSDDLLASGPEIVGSSLLGVRTWSPLLRT